MRVLLLLLLFTTKLLSQNNLEFINKISLNKFKETQEYYINANKFNLLLKKSVYRPYDKIIFLFIKDKGSSDGDIFVFTKNRKSKKINLYYKEKLIKCFVFDKIEVDKEFYVKEDFVEGGSESLLLGFDLMSSSPYFGRLDSGSLKSFEEHLLNSKFDILRLFLSKIPSTLPYEE